MIGGFVILDFGSQVSQLIARRLREMDVFSELLPYNASLEEIQKRKPIGIILSGGPQSVNDPKSPQRDLEELKALCPLMGICYGMQLLAKANGGVVQKAEVQEYGLQKVTWSKEIAGVPQIQNVWMSHGDVVLVPPPGFKTIALSKENHPAALEGPNTLAVQFHPEVTHTEFGEKVLRHFVFDMCNAEPNWVAPNMAQEVLLKTKESVPEGEHVIVGLSGGVDSTVTARLCTKALGHERVHCIFINNGLLRKGEYEEVLERYKKLGLNVTGVHAEKAFLKRLEGVDDPEEKRKIIGHVFIEVFDHCVSQMEPKPKWLAQGTLYPDVIESISPLGESVTIKSHHNVGGLPEKMDLQLLEPLRELFKDEVRAIGREMGIPQDSLQRHPFPGPGLAIRIMGAINADDLNTLKDCDAIYIEELKKEGLYDDIWQAFCVLLPVRTVGVQGDARTYGKVLALRAVVSNDAMTADWYPFSKDFLATVSNRITNEVRDVNRVVYDVTSKPPGTIEWE